MAETSAREIVRLYLVSNGLDGLYSKDGECACEHTDLAPCGEMQQDCIAGHKVPCPPDCGEHDWHINGGPKP